MCLFIATGAPKYFSPAVYLYFLVIKCQNALSSSEIKKIYQDIFRTPEMASKRKATEETIKQKVNIPESEEDEALGKELELDNSGSDDSDDSDSSVYSELEEDESEDESDEASSDSEESDDEGDAVESLSAKNIKNKTKVSKAKEDEYNYDSSDEEDIRNTIGNIPVNWYDEYEHIGYDLDGAKIRKPKRGDELENFLSRMENPEHGVTVEDTSTGQKVVLSET